MRLAWLVPGCCFVCSGCLFGFDHDFDDHEDDPPPPVSIATGAELGLRLDSSGPCSEIGSACLSDRIETVLDVVVAHEAIVELGTRTLDPDLGSLVVDLHAKKRGSTKLEVHYVDHHGEEHNDVIDLRVADLERVELDVSCTDFSHEGTVFPVTTGAVVPFSHAAFDEEGNQLATGRMEVVEDFGDFVVSGPPREDGEIRQATAPSTVGSHAWPLLGEASATPTFVVFVAGQFDLELSEVSAPPYSTGVRVARMVDDAPICVHEGDVLADIRVTAGSCLPLVAGIEIVDPVPVSLTEHDVELALSGVGQCEVQATSSGGSTASLTLAVDNPAPIPKPGTGTELGPTPIEHGGELAQHGECTTTSNLSNGNCEIVDAAGIILPDADCLYDISWGKQHYDGTIPGELHGELVAVGLATELRVDIRYELIGLIPFGKYAPNDLRVEATPASVMVDSNGCNQDDQEVLALVPESEGDFDLALSADNAFESTHFELRARTVSRLSVDFGVEDVTQTGDGSQAWFFVGSEVEPTFAYEDASGNRLWGTGPILAASDTASAGATIAWDTVETGVAPNVISLSAAVAPQIHRIGVVDGASVSSVEGLSVQQLAVDAVQCFEAYPVAADGARIHGTSPVRPQLRRTGDDAVVFEIEVFTNFEGELCLRGLAPGSTTLQLDWGGASTQATWTVN